MSNGLKRLIILIAGAVLVIGLVVFFAVGMRAQREKELEQQQHLWELEQKYEELLREKERLESRIEFVKSSEGLLQYARDYLGYLAPGDIRIEDAE